MRPESEYRPAEQLQSIICVAVSLPICFDLLPPEFRVTFRPGRMFWAAVPETAIDENGDLPPGKGDIRNSTRLPQNLIVDSVAQTDSIQLLPQCYFRTCPFLPDPRHAPTGRG